MGKQVYFTILLMMMYAGGFASAVGAAGLNCSKAQTPIEKTVCDDPDLRAMDTRVAKAYNRLLSELDPQGAKALKSDQRWFLIARDNSARVTVGRVDKEDLSDALHFRAKFLESIVAHPAPGLSGRWERAFSIRTVPEDRLVALPNSSGRKRPDQASRQPSKRRHPTDLTL